MKDIKDFKNALIKMIMVKGILYEADIEPTDRKVNHLMDDKLLASLFNNKWELGGDLELRTIMGIYGRKKGLFTLFNCVNGKLKII